LLVPKFKAFGEEQNQMTQALNVALMLVSYQAAILL
jgi:hypothetical protein